MLNFRKKKLLVDIATLLICYHFVFDSLSKILNNGTQTWLFVRKVDSIESFLNERDLLPFPFSKLVLDYGSFLLYAVGCLQLSIVWLLIRSNETQPNPTLISTLVWCLVFDLAVINNPFVELMREREQATFEFGLDVGLIGCLLMLGGFRNKIESG